MLKSAILVLTGSVFSSLALLLRNLLVARLISAENFGIAATFALSMAVLEMISAIGLQQLIVQAENGEDPNLQAGLQGFHLLRGIFSGVILFSLAHPLAQFLGIAEVAWAYQVLAVVPVLRGFMHFDIYRTQRKMLFLPLMFSKVAPALLSVFLIWPFFKLFGDYRVMLYAYIVQWGGMTLASHFMAQRSYRLTMDRSVILHALQFGWPLLINNVLLMLVFQGDKLIVGREMGMTSLAILALGFTLTLTPMLVVAQSLQTFLLPQLSAVKMDQERFTPLALATLQANLAGGLLFVVVVIVAGEMVVETLYGAKYAALVPLLTWLAILQTFRLFREGCSTVALSQGHTSNAMIGNMFRVLSIPVSWYVAATGGSLLEIIWIATVAEVLGFFTSMGLVIYRLELRLSALLGPLGLALFVLVLAAALQMKAFSDLASGANWVTGGIAAVSLLGIAMMKDLRRYISELWLKRFD